MMMKPRGCSLVFTCPHFSHFVLHNSQHTQPHSQTMTTGKQEFFQNDAAAASEKKRAGSPLPPVAAKKKQQVREIVSEKAGARACACVRVHTHITSPTESRIYRNGGRRRRPPGHDKIEPSGPRRRAAAVDGGRRRRPTEERRKGGALTWPKSAHANSAKTWHEPSKTIKKRTTHRHVKRKARSCRSILGHPATTVTNFLVDPKFHIATSLARESTHKHAEQTKERISTHSLIPGSICTS